MASHGGATDTALVTRAQHGDEEAFATLAAAIGDRLNAVAHRILRDTNLAEDATQQALLTIWPTLPSFATRRASTPGRTGSASMPFTSRAGATASGLRTSASSRLKSRRWVGLELDP